MPKEGSESQLISGTHQDDRETFGDHYERNLKIYFSSPQIRAKLLTPYRHSTNYWEQYLKKMNKLQELLDQQEYVLLDGAMGTMLFAAGLEEGAAPEAWNLDQPDRIREVHRKYIAAGSQVILTNTFGGTRYRLNLHGLQDQVNELNRIAATLARAEADAVPQPVVVAGSMGPTGELLSPMGSMTYEDAFTAFSEQAKGLSEGGADVLWVVTMSDVNEAKAAVEGARSVSDLPIVATMSLSISDNTFFSPSIRYSPSISFLERAILFFKSAKVWNI